MQRLVICTLLASSALSGCSVFSLNAAPLIEMAKAAGEAVISSSKEQQGEASHVQRHVQDVPRQVCIEFNPYTPMDDLVPALQQSLSRHQVSSRVYEAGTLQDACRVWLKYSAQIEWGIPPRSQSHAPYLSSAELTLLSSQGQVLATGQYRHNPRQFWSSQWASTQNKLDALVTALVSAP